MKKNPRDVRIREVKTGFEEYRYRSPMKFGGKVVTGVTLSNVELRAQGRDGREAIGKGSMTMGATWSFPSDVMGYEETLGAMLALTEKVRRIIEANGEYGHPIELMTAMEEVFLKAAEETTAELKLKEPIPKLCTLVVVSPFDAALHDAYGKLHGVNVYDAYGKGWMNRDLSAYLTDEFKGEYLDKYTLRTPKASMPLYHLVGALDPLTDADVKNRIEDGLPNTLGEWIIRDGLTRLKIKLNGNDLAWDVDRVLAIDKVAAQAQKKRGVKRWYYSADFNEKCPNVAYLVDFMKRINEANPACFQRIEYIEQPTSRYLKEHMDNKMHEAAKIKPVVIDEALVDFEHLQLSMRLGYSGVALKTCKGHSQALLMAAAALKYRLFLCVQDLTLVGASFLHSAGLCARIPHVAAIEGNGRQYCPLANKGWEDKWPTIFKVTDGTLGTHVLTLPGLGHYEG
jgi:L-alanine-DL-glutamate epimerase-like enolase superfamily enzyme